MKKNKQQKHNSFMATSKLIGLIVAICVAIIILYAMVLIALISLESIKMGLTLELTPLNTLIAGAITLATAYVGFYINMAKAEHIEDKKNEITKEIKELEKDGISEEEIQEINNLKENLEDLKDKLDTIKEDNEVETFLG